MLISAFLVPILLPRNCSCKLADSTVLLSRNCSCKVADSTVLLSRNCSCKVVDSTEPDILLSRNCSCKVADSTEPDIQRVGSTAGSTFTTTSYAYNFQCIIIGFILFSFYIHWLKELSYCHKLKFSMSYVFTTWWCKPLICQTKIILSNRIHSLIYHRFMT